MKKSITIFTLFNASFAYNSLSIFIILVRLICTITIRVVDLIALNWCLKRLSLRWVLLVSGGEIASPLAAERELTIFFGHADSANELELFLRYGYLVFGRTSVVFAGFVVPIVAAVAHDHNLFEVLQVCAMAVGGHAAGVGEQLCVSTGAVLEVEALVVEVGDFLVLGFFEFDEVDLLDHVVPGECHLTSRALDLLLAGVQ